MARAYEVARCSIDPSTQNGALLATPDGAFLNGTQAFNRFPRGVRMDPTRWERPSKYEYIEHAERGAIYAAARLGIATEGKIMICPWAACPACARGIIEAGIARLVTCRNDSGHWEDSVQLGHSMLEEAGVTVEFFEKKLGLDPIRRNGKEFWP